MELKDLINKIFKFDVEADFYNDDEKVEIVDAFKELLNKDEDSVKDFVKKVFASAIDVAKDLELVSDEDESNDEEKSEEEMPKEESMETSEDEKVEEIKVEEPSQELKTESVFINRASKYLY